MNSKKCIVVDLDNTLWGGVVGEDGIEGIALSLSHPGASFIAFQQVLLDMYHRGILLAINSRNNNTDAMAVIREHPNMILKEEHFSAMRINWNDKVANLKELAQELNMGLDSMVFLDDDPTNRAEVRAMLPEVDVPELPTRPEAYAKFLLALPYFPATAVTDEDTLRGSLYVTERLRRSAEQSFATRDEFLKDLGLELRVCVDDASSSVRLSQMTEKTNQFNINKIPLSQEAILQLINDPDYTVFHASVTDRFGAHGITNLAIIKKNGGRQHIEHFLMSCRVFGRGIEDAFLSSIREAAVRDGAKRITIDFVPSEKNAPAADFVARFFLDGEMVLSGNTTAPEWIHTDYGKV